MLFGAADCSYANSICRFHRGSYTAKYRLPDRTRTSTASAKQALIHSRRRAEHRLLARWQVYIIAPH